MSTAGAGLLAKCRVMPAGKDSTISPVIFTMHLQRQAQRPRGRKRRAQNAAQDGWCGESPPFPSQAPTPVPRPHGRHLLAGVGSLEVSIDGLSEGGSDRQGVLCPHGERAGAP